MKNLLSVSVLMLLLAACAASSPGNSTNTAVGAEREPFRAANYELGPGDKVRVNVFGEEELSGEFTVDGAGQISLPLVGEVKAEGLTVASLRQAIEASLMEGYLKEPRVSAEVATYRPYYILGEVEKPGTYAYQSGITVLNAVATAEGFTYRANQRYVFIRRDGENTEVRYDLNSTTPVRPGDTIRIGERFF